jgi:hypothetical protein
MGLSSMACQAHARRPVPEVLWNLCALGGCKASDRLDLPRSLPWHVSLKGGGGVSTMDIDYEFVLFVLSSFKR